MVAALVLAIASASSAACRPALAPVPPSAMPTGPGGRPVASVTRVAWAVARDGTRAIDVVVPDARQLPYTPQPAKGLRQEPGTHRLTLELDEGSPWLSEAGAIVDYGRAHVRGSVPAGGGRWSLAGGTSRPILAAELRTVEGGAILTVTPEWGGHAESSRGRGSRHAAAYRSEPDGSLVLTRAVGSIRHATLAATDDGLLISSKRALAAPIPGEDGRWIGARLEPGTHHLRADGTITRTSERVFSSLAVDGERIWGVEHRRRRHELVGLDRAGRVFFAQRIDGPMDPQPFAELVCAQAPYPFGLEPDAARPCFTLDGRPVAASEVPRDHLIEAADGWRVLQTAEEIQVFDATDRLVWRQPVPADASPAVLTEAGRVCVLSERAHSGTLGRLSCWGAALGEGSSSHAASPR